MNTVDLLLGLDTKSILKPVKDIEIKRLSTIAGSPVIFKCQAVDSDDYNDIQQNAIKLNSKGDLTGIDMGEMQLFMVLGGVQEPNLKDAKLLSHFGVVTPKELVKKLLLPGELTTLFNEINNLSGFGDNAVEEIKNS